MATNRYTPKPKVDESKRQSFVRESVRTSYPTSRSNTLESDMQFKAALTNRTKKVKVSLAPLPWEGKSEQ